jgi:hypothetical protein
MEPTLIFAGAQAQQIITSETEYSQPRNFDFRNAILGAVAPALGMSLKEGRLAINSGDNGILPKLAHRILVEYDVLTNGINKKNPSYGAVFSGVIPMASFSGAVRLPPLVAIYEMLSENQAQQNDGVTSECEAGIQAAVANVCAGGEGTVLTMCPGSPTIGPNVKNDPYTNKPTRSLSFSGAGIYAGQTACDSGAPAIITDAIRRSGSQPISTETPANVVQVAGEEELEAIPTPDFSQSDHRCLVYGVDTGPYSSSAENTIKQKIELRIIGPEDDIEELKKTGFIIDTTSPESAIRTINDALRATIWSEMTEAGYYRLAGPDFAYTFPGDSIIYLPAYEVPRTMGEFLECVQSQDGIEYLKRLPVNNPLATPEKPSIGERFVTSQGNMWKSLLERLRRIFSFPWGN